MPGLVPGILFRHPQFIMPGLVPRIPVRHPQIIMPGLVPGILFRCTRKDRRDKPGDDETEKRISRQRRQNRRPNRHPCLEHALS
jgi:hypothetical protein